MAKQRIVNTKFWDDKYIRSLDPHGKLLFIYLFTNSLATIAGAYEIEIDRIRFDTKINIAKIESLLDKFRVDGKAEYHDGWLLMVNTIAHQTTVNAKIKKGIEEAVKCCPDWVKDRLSIAYDWLSHLNLNSNTNSNTNPGGPPLLEIHLGTILGGVKKELGLTRLVRSVETEWLEHGELAFQNNRSAEEFLECFNLLRRQTWRNGPVEPKHVTKSLPEIQKLRAEIKSQVKNGNEPLPTLEEKLADDASNRAVLRNPPKTVEAKGIQ